MKTSNSIKISYFLMWLNISWLTIATPYLVFFSDAELWNIPFSFVVNGGAAVFISRSIGRQKEREYLEKVWENSDE